MLLKTSKLYKLLPCRTRNILLCAYNSTGVPKEERIKVGNSEVNYVKVGTGSHNVLCMPGALGTIWTSFKAQVEGFDRDSFTLVAWDPPGYGKSRPPERQFPINFYEIDADNANELMQNLGIPKYSLLGWSGGGISSMILASKYPEAVNKLVVWGTNSFILPHEIENYKKIRDIKTWSKRMRDPLIAIYGEALLAKYWSQWVDAVIAMFEAGDMCSDKLKDIKCPTFILYGEKDPIVDRSHASHLHSQITGSRLHLYPDGKHNVHLSHTEDFNRIVQEFLLQA